jgi:Asp/Glu/hydantoin racemase
MKTVVAIYTALALVEDTKKLFAEIVPDCRLINIVDDSLIPDVMNAGQVTGSVARRLLDYYRDAEEAGADLILNTCSSVGEVADMGRRVAGVPIIKIDDAMTAKAVEMGKTVGVIATVATTLGPTVRLVRSQAEKIDKEIKIVEGLAGSAFQALLAGRPEEHDAILLQTAKDLAAQVDVIVLAQGSMARMEAKLAAETGKPVLASPRLAVEAVRDVLKGAMQ